MNEITLKIADMIIDDPNIEGGVKYVGEKVFWNMDGGVPASEWVRQEVKSKKTHQNCVPIMSALNTATETTESRGSVCDGYLGYMVSVANSVYKNGTDVFIVSSASTMGNGLSVIPENFEKCCSLFAARRSIKRDWLNDQDEYIGGFICRT